MPLSLMLKGTEPTSSSDAFRRCCLAPHHINFWSTEMLQMNYHQLWAWAQVLAAKTLCVTGSLQPPSEGNSWLKRSEATIAMYDDVLDEKPGSSPRVGSIQVPTWSQLWLSLHFNPLAKILDKTKPKFTSTARQVKDKDIEETDASVLHKMGTHHSWVITPYQLSHSTTHGKSPFKRITTHYFPLKMTPNRYFKPV